jgi:hypothetical protein
MKKAIGIAVLAVAAMCVAQAQDVSGDWQGSLATGLGELRIVLHITKAADGTLKATMDSPDQAVVGMPVESITLDGSKLKFTANVVKGSYEGAVKNAGLITGTWSQPKKMQLDFKKTTTAIKLEHPPAAPSDIDGTWEGVADVPSLGKQHLTFHLKNTGDGLTATTDDPDLSVKGWPAAAVVRKGSSVKIEMPQIGGSFAGKLNKDLSVMSGDWSTGPSQYVLTLKRAKEQPAEAPKATPAPAPTHN